MQDLLKTLWRDDSGQDTTEYVLLVLLAAFAVTAGMLVLPTEINETFSETAAGLGGGAGFREPPFSHLGPDQPATIPF